ncbi:hypothetical protein LB566_29360 [Mesorhizobium sp. CA13]|uniref:hypothetical protein n=1 Tax=Mesorhizobium sp. CA13 TaxID=2876643 RepID=UPI001CCE333D|nr:hypothetical protein [Mesorhizobium sp. CA13]MBZ9857895.1 hypothetical protein [Mesorhizobium sp. CA13]
MANLSEKKDAEIDQWIRNHEQKRATGAPLYLQLLEERARRSQGKGHLSIDKSLELLSQAAIEQRCVTYGDLAKASNVEWSQARHRMSGANGHLDRLLDVCHVRNLPMLPAICVNESGRDTGELEASALEGFAAGARRLGFAVADALSFHHQTRDACWQWGRDQSRTG